jgi:hypothetical protein
MKKLLLFAVALVLLAGCKKDHTKNNAADPLNGTWEYRGTACYCEAAIDTVNNKPGNGNIISFLNGTYKHTEKGQVIKSGNYVILNDQVTFDGTTQQVTRIIYDGDTAAAKTFFKINADKLTLFGTIPLEVDGPEEYYARINGQTP